MNNLIGSLFSSSEYEQLTEDDFKSDVPNLSLQIFKGKYSLTYILDFSQSQINPQEIKRKIGDIKALIKKREKEYRNSYNSFWDLYLLIFLNPQVLDKPEMQSMINTYQTDKYVCRILFFDSSSQSDFKASLQNYLPFYDLPDFTGEDSSEGSIFTKSHFVSKVLEFKDNKDTFKEAVREGEFNVN
jgi:hypothetical protein